LVMIQNCIQKTVTFVQLVTSRSAGLALALLNTVLKGINIYIVNYSPWILQGHHAWNLCIWSQIYKYNIQTIAQTFRFAPYISRSDSGLAV